MRVVLTEKLVSYLRKKDVCAILVDVAECKSCGGAVGELYARPCKRSEARRLLDRGASGQRVLSCEDETGELVEIGGTQLRLIVARRSIRLEEEVRLDLRRMLGIPDVKVTGATF